MRRARLFHLSVVGLSVGILLASRGAPARAQSACLGDCNGDGVVAIDELIRGVSLALGTSGRACTPLAGDDGRITVDRLVAAVRSALDGCAAAPTLGPLISGTAAYVRGTFVWTDYAYDDRGANADAATGGDHTQSAFAGGDTKYPPEAAPGNAADLIQLQIGLQDGAVSIRAVLESLVNPSLPVLAVAFDTDNDASTGAGALPGDQWLADGGLGVEAMVVIAADGGALWRFAGGEWTRTASFAAAVDAETNTMESIVPAAELQPGRATWRAFGALGLAAETGNWLDGAAPVYDLAFVGPELLVRWQENLQADILAGALPAADAAADIDFARVADGVTALPHLGPGFHTFLYRSSLRLAEGIDSTSGNPVFLGPYQPYAVYIPQDFPSPTPLAVFLHGLDQNHVGAIHIGTDQQYLGTGRAMSEDPYLLADIIPDGFDYSPPTLQVLPLARGEGLFYDGIAVQDVLDVADEAQRRFDVDPDRVALEGASMGGIGTFRLASLLPDRWSAAMPLIGFQALPQLTENLLNVPVRQINGAVDPLIAEAAATASAARLDELEYDHRYWLGAQRGHEISGPLHSCVFDEVAAFVRDPNPARVRYVVDPSLDRIDDATGLALRFDAAYWVSGLVVRDVSTTGRIDAVSLAKPRFEQTVTRIDEMHDNLSEGANFCGPNPDVHTNDMWRERAVVLTRGAELPRSNGLTVTAVNLAAARIDVARAGLERQSDASVAVDTDGDLALTLAGLARAQVVVRSGAEPVAADDDGRATIALAAGVHALTIQAR